MFLDTEKKCSIYAYRPVACRMFFSVTNPEWCHPADQNFDNAINPHLEPSSAIKDLLKKLSSEVKFAELPKDLISGMHILLKRMEKKCILLKNQRF